MVLLTEGRKRDFKQGQNGKLSQKTEVKDRKFEEWELEVHDKTFIIR